MQVGDKVAYSAKWLRSVGIFTGPLPFARGEVVALEKLSTETTLAQVKWDRAGVPEKVNIRNLVVWNRDRGLAAGA